ncbi:MAG: hypothetical protein P4M01_10815, partial [Acidobacteriota bacterium]|nr:hypothetical protein [Acidobacteriota bacterium]
LDFAGRLQRCKGLEVTRGIPATMFFRHGRRVSRREICPAWGGFVASAQEEQGAAWRRGNPGQVFPVYFL